MKKIILIGGGGHCKSCIDVIEAAGAFKIMGILDSADKVGQAVCGYSIVGTDDRIEEFAKLGYGFHVTVGHLKSPATREKIFTRLQALKAETPVIISPLARVSSHAQVGEGTIIMHFALVNADAEVGVNCIVNSRALIEHDAFVGDHCHVSTGAILNGNAQLGSRSFFGSGAVSKEGAIIAEGSFVKANSIVK
jgi:sugar O-acyltransferase (sialic acid O-acetyltransferase NeuD family)